MNARKVGVAIVWTIIAIVVVFITLMLVLDVGTVGSKKVEYTDFEQMLITKAKQIYLEKKDQGTDFSLGPCLSNDLQPDWVFDIVHDPRQEIDNLPQYQCSAFNDGKAKHFVEFDPKGNLIRLE